jgi:E3 ubiquitin-protein ligase MYCBP2
MLPDPLFDLLLDLATSHGPESAAANDGSHLTAVACACLLSLVVVRGDTGKLLSATAALLMCPRALASQNIHVSFDGNLDYFLSTDSHGLCF